MHITRSTQILLLVLLFLSVGCADSVRFMRTPGMVDMPMPSLFVEPVVEMSAAVVPVGVARTMELRIENTGNIDIVDVEFLNVLAPWGIVENTCQGATVPPEGSCALVMEFMSLEAGDYKMSITSNATFSREESQTVIHEFAISAVRYDVYNGMLELMIDRQNTFQIFNDPRFIEELDLIPDGIVDTTDLNYFIEWATLSAEARVDILSAYHSIVADFIEAGVHEGHLDFNEDGQLDDYDIEILEGLIAVTAHDSSASF